MKVERKTLRFRNFKLSNVVVNYIWALQQQIKLMFYRKCIAPRWQMFLLQSQTKFFKIENIKLVLFVDNILSCDNALYFFLRTRKHMNKSARVRKNNSNLHP